MTASWMHLLRSAALKRWIVACFMLAVGAATASPFIQPQNMQLLCAANGVVKLVSISDPSGSLADESLGDVAGVHKLDCALCLPAMVAPPPLQSLPTSNDALSHALHPIVQASLASLTAPPLPARGPPSDFTPLLKQ